MGSEQENIENMTSKRKFFNNAAIAAPHFMNPEADLVTHDGEIRPQQKATNFADMFQDIYETSDKFVRHIIDVHQNVAGEEKLRESLLEIALRPDTPDNTAKTIEAYSTDELTDYVCLLYGQKIYDLEEKYTQAENILDDWIQQNKGQDKVYDFPAFLEFHIKHPDNIYAEPLAADHGNDERYALENQLCRICLKSPYSAFSKLFSDYKSPETPDTPFKKELLTDIQRARIVCPDQHVYEYIKQATHHNPKSALRRNSADGMGAILEDNRLVAPKRMTGHRVLFQKFALPTDSTERGSVVEMQILPQSIMDANDITHIIMDKADDLLNVPDPDVEARIYANFLYNMCSFIHRRCAEHGGFQRLVGEGFDPNETIHRMMLEDQRPEIYSAVFQVEKTIEEMLADIRNGRDYEGRMPLLLLNIDSAVEKAVSTWKKSEDQIQQLFDQIDARIDLIAGPNAKTSAKDHREASLLKDVQRLIYEQAMDTNIFEHLKPPANASDNTDNLMDIIVAHPELCEMVENLVEQTESLTTSVILGHPPNVSSITAHCLGLVNQELIASTTDKKALTQALNKQASQSRLDDIANAYNETTKNLLDRRRQIEFYGSALTPQKGQSENAYVGIQRDIFGNINLAVEYKNGDLKQLDMQKLKDKFQKSYEKIDNPAQNVPDDIRKKIGQKMFRFSQIAERDNNNAGQNINLG